MQSLKFYNFWDFVSFSYYFIKNDLKIKKFLMGKVFPLKGSGAVEIRIIYSEFQIPNSYTKKKWYGSLTVVLIPQISSVWEKIFQNQCPKMVTKILNMPARVAGTTKEAHPFVVAILQAVVGPPTLALDAKSNILRSIPNIFPNPRVTIRCTVTWTKASTNILGVVLMTFQILP